MKKNLLFILAILFIAVSNVVIGQDQVAHLWKAEWKDIHNISPRDSKRWQDFEVGAYMYNRTMNDPEEITIGVVFNILDFNNSNKIDEQRIYDQIEKLNQAFGDLNI